MALPLRTGYVCMYVQLLLPLGMYVCMCSYYYFIGSLIICIKQTNRYIFFFFKYANKKFNCMYVCGEYVKECN